jgi:hypothetical protein
VADAGTSVDGGNEKQEGVDVHFPSASLGLERLKSSAALRESFSFDPLLECTHLARIRSGKGERS